MVFAPVSRSIKDKVIGLYLAGGGRNSIARQLHGQVSHGSISNIINAYKLKQSLQPESLEQQQPSLGLAGISDGISIKKVGSAGVGLANKTNTKGQEQPDLNKSDRVITFPEEGLSEIEFEKNPDISIESHVTNTQDFQENGYPVDQGQGQGKGSPLSWFTNGWGEIKSEISQTGHHSTESPSILTNPSMAVGSPELSSGQIAIESTNGLTIVSNHQGLQKKFAREQVVVSSTGEKAESKAIPRPGAIEARLAQEKIAWDYYGPGWTQVLNQIRREKDQRRHELLSIDRRESRLEEWRKRLEQRESNVKDRETRVFEVEPFLALAKKFHSMKLTLGEVLLWIGTINEVAQNQKSDTKSAAIFVTEELRLYRQLGGIQRQIERANQELALINMTTISKRQALTVLIDLLNRGVTESQIVQLINFAGEWNKYWTTNNGSLQRQNNNLQQPNNGSKNPGSIDGNFSWNNGYDGNLSINDLIRLNLLKSTTTNMLNRMETSRTTLR